MNPNLPKPAIAAVGAFSTIVLVWSLFTVSTAYDPAGAPVPTSPAQATAATKAPASAQDIAAGLAVFKSKGCDACHGPRGQGGIGPKLQGLLGSTVDLDDGSSVVADVGYIRQSIEDPDAELTSGFYVRMPKNSFTDGELDRIVDYVSSLASDP